MDASPSSAAPVPLVLVDRPAAGVGRVTLNRPEARNALSLDLLAALAKALDALACDNALRCLVVTGAGGQAFSAGADLRERLSMTVAERTAHTAAVSAAADAFEAFPLPVVAAVGGFALAGGAELALACDLRVASDEAVFGFPEVGLGIFPGAGAPVRLPRVVGPATARDLLLTGRRVGAHEAFRLGLVQWVVPAAELAERAVGVAGEIAANAPLATRALKRALVESDGLPAAEAQRVVGRYRQPLDETADYAEGLAAFAERRRPRFRGV